MTNMQTWTTQPWHNDRVEHATPDSPRRWFGRRRGATQPQPVVDLREVGLASDDPETVVARLARLRDAGLITNAEFQKERRTLLGSDDTWR
jgi:hypothetical protein